MRQQAARREWLRGAGWREPAVDGSASGSLPIELTVVEPIAKAGLGRDYRTRRLLVLADLVALLCGIASWSLFTIPNPGQHVLWTLFTLPFWLVLLNIYGLYAAGLRRVGYATVDDIPAMAHAFLVGGVATWLYLQVSPTGKLGFSELLA